MLNSKLESTLIKEQRFNGCHSQLSPTRLQSELIYHSKGNVSWPNVFTRTCQYIKQENIVDDGCDGCDEKEKQSC